MRSTEAVPCIELSGGLDSNTVAALAKTSGFDFTTASIKAPGFDATDESHLIERALEHLNVPNIAISVDELSYFDHLEKSLHRTGRVHSTASMCILPSVYAKVGNEGHRVILDGFDGDTVVGHGYEQLALLASRGEWTRCAQLIKDVKRVNSDRASSKMWGFYVEPILRSSAAKLGIRSYLHLVETLTRFMGDSYWEATRYALRMMARHEQGDHSVLSGGYKDLPSDTIDANKDIWFEYAAATALNDLIGWGLEWKNGFASAYGVEVRHPFMDVRLVEFCLSVPATYKLRRGYNRWVMRECMRKIVPDEILWRAEKANFRPVLQHVIVSLEERKFDSAVEILCSHEGISKVASRDALSAFARIRSGEVEPKDYTALWSALYFVAWFKDYAALAPSPTSNSCQTQL
jgi:asparagine synthase (glutamine-hydrolysing)